MNAGNAELWKAIFVLIAGVAVLSAAMTNLVVQRQMQKRGYGWFVSIIVSGPTGWAVAIAIVAAYFVIGHAIQKILQ